MSLTIADVEHVAALARLGLTAEEKERLRDQLSSILQHIDALSDVDTAAISPTAQVVPLSNVMRDDIATGSLPRELVLSNAPRQTDGFFEVDAVLGGNEDEGGA
ncbi:MAG: Asp-tRNA(Asn)/Glu-tRNA(Gln) amidotransferase subunit GatC [Thermomicrobiales bacterium]